MQDSTIHPTSDPRFATSYEGCNPSLEPLVPSGTRCALDVGCGRGGTAAWLSARGIEVDGVSWNQGELDAAKAFCRRVICCDLSLGIPEAQDGAYDLVICSHLLEHIAYPQRLLADVYRALKPGGHLLVAIPNLFFWADRLKLLRGQWRYVKSGTFDYTHLRWYTDETMAELLHEHGFIRHHFHAEGWIPLPGLRLLIGNRLRRKLDSLVCRCWPGLFGKQLLYSVRKPDLSGARAHEG